MKKNRIKNIGFSIVCVIALLGTNSFAKGQYNGKNYESSSQNIQTNKMQDTELSEEQIEDLIFMYQEEKVARDVYLKLHEEWGMQIFKNIANAEQTHMNAVKGLLVKYDIPIPITEEDIGSFVLPELQLLYNDLMEKGLVSKIDALEVGVIIEEKDIIDISEKMEGAPFDIERVYGNLLDGSYSHLDAFNKVLNK